MKPLKELIQERLILSNRPKYTLFPKTKDELREMIKQEIVKHGNNCSLNHIDTYDITDMTRLFYKSKFNGDISKWNVSNVKDMYGMFEESEFNGNISKWDVSNVDDMAYMFAQTKFNQDISRWNVSNVTKMEYMFYNSKFNQDISNWKINSTCDTGGVFAYGIIEDKYKPKSVN